MSRDGELNEGESELDKTLVVNKEEEAELHLEPFPIIIEEDILERYLSHLMHKEFSTVKERLEMFYDNRIKREVEVLPLTSIEILVLSPAGTTPMNEQILRSHMRSYMEKENEHGFLLYEVPFAAGDFFVFAYKPYVVQKKGYLDRDKVYQKCLLYFKELPNEKTPSVRPNVNPNEQLSRGALINVLFAGCKKTNAPKFLINAVLTYELKNLKRKTKRRQDTEVYEIPIDGKRINFHPVSIGEDSLAQRIREKMEQLSQTNILCLIFSLDAKQKDIQDILDNFPLTNIIIVTHSNRVSVVEVITISSSNRETFRVRGDYRICMKEVKKL